jgi:parvulin-like peptidyl-prolyl isomerase
MIRARCCVSACGPIGPIAWIAILMAGWLSASLAQAQSPRAVKSRVVGQPAKSSQPPAAKATAAGAASRPSANAAESKPAIVAVVNGQSIARQELAKQCLDRYGQAVLESLVNKHLILEACRQKNVRITHQDIEEEIDRIAARFNLPKDRWLQMLQQERNISAEQYRRDIIWPTLALKHLASDQLNVGDEELKREFESEYGPKVQVRMIATSDAAKAKELLTQAKADPEEFGILAKNHSEDPNSAAARGLIPPIRRHVGDATVEKVCFALQPGEISSVVSVAGQHLIFKCEKHLPAAHISPQYRQSAHDRLKDRIVDRNLRLASAKIFQQLQTTARVENVLNDPDRRKQLPAIAATINDQQISIAQLAEECIARHGVDVLDAEINFMLLQQALKSKQRSVSGEEIDVEVARAAEAYGYMTNDQKPDVQSWLKEVTEREGMEVDVYVRDAVWPSVALKKLVEDQVEVTDQDRQKGFEANYGPRVEVLAIVLSNQRTAQEVWDLARSNLTPTFFGELAAQYSIEPVSRANMGEVPPIRRFSGQPQVEEEAFSLTQQDPLSAIVAVADKCIILYYLGRTEPVVTELDDVRDELNKDIHEKKLRLAMSQEFDRLKEVAQIDNFLAGRSQAGGKSQAATSSSSPDVRPARSSPQLVRPASQRKTTSR